MLIVDFCSKCIFTIYFVLECQVNAEVVLPHWTILRVISPCVFACKISFGLNKKSTEIPMKSMFKLLPVIVHSQNMCIVTYDFKSKNKRIALLSKRNLVWLSRFLVIRNKKLGHHLYNDLTRW